MAPKTTKTATAPAIKKSAVTTPLTTPRSSTKVAPKKSTTVAPLVIKAVSHPSHDQIAKRAYVLFERRGHIHGHDLEDWLIAEAELLSGMVL